MASLYISEFNDVALTGIRHRTDFAPQPSIATQKVTFTTTVASDALSDETFLVRVVADADAHLEFGAAPTATTSSMLIKSGVPEYFGVKPGQKIAAVAV